MLLSNIGKSFPAWATEGLAELFMTAKFDEKGNVIIGAPNPSRTFAIASMSRWSVKQLIESFSPEKRNSFKEVVLAEHPRKGEYAFGFVTSELVVEGPDGKRDMVTVFVPTNNLYLGDVIVLSRDETKQHYMRVEYEQSVAATDEIIYRNFQRLLEFRVGDVRDFHSVAAVLQDGKRVVQRLIDVRLTDDTNDATHATQPLQSQAKAESRSGPAGRRLQTTAGRTREPDSSTSRQSSKNRAAASIAATRDPAAQARG